MLKLFNCRWDEVPIVAVDVETTGKSVGHDRACSVAIVRFEQGIVVDWAETLVDPGIPIPAEATDVHGITDEQVAGKPKIADWFATGRVMSLLDGAQPVAYNGNFDRRFVPPFIDPWEWPWLDALTLVRKIDRYCSGPGRHKLAATCERHGIVLDNAHTAGDDARATGHLLFKLGRQMFPENYTLGQALGWQMRMEAVEWERFWGWKSKLPPREAGAA